MNPTPDPKPTDHPFMPTSLALSERGGHNCLLCAPDSIWKCDEFAHPTWREMEWWPLTKDEAEKLHADLGEMARKRRKALPGEQMP